MPRCWAKRAALPGVGEATATTSAFGTKCWKAWAWMSATKPEPIRPTFTVSCMVLCLRVHVVSPGMPGLPAQDLFGVGAVHQGAKGMAGEIGVAHGQISGSVRLRRDERAVPLR